MKKISVVIPMYYEEEVADICYKRVVNNLKKLSDKYNYEIIFINDGSKDFTLEILKKIASNDDNVKIISVVYGKRKTREGESIFKLLTARMFYNTLNKLSEIEIPKDTGDFRLVDRKVIDVIATLPEHNKFLRGLFSWVGFNQYAYEYNRVNRVAGKTKYPFKKMFKLATDGILSFSAKPLKIVGAIGIFSVIVSIIILIYSIVSYMFKLNSLTPGWTSIMCTMTFLGGIILISLWMIGEYIARIYEEVMGRPEYIIDELINFKGEEYEEN